MTRPILALVLATLLLGSGGFTTERVDGSSGAPESSITRYALMGAFEVHDSGGGAVLEHHACADGCSTLMTLALLVDASLASTTASRSATLQLDGEHAHALAPVRSPFQPPR